MAYSFDTNSAGLMVPSLSLEERRALRTIAYKLCTKAMGGTATARDIQQLEEIDTMLFADRAPMKYEGAAHQLSTALIKEFYKNNPALLEQLKPEKKAWTVEDAIAASEGAEGKGEGVFILDAHGNVLDTVSEDQFLSQLERVGWMNSLDRILAQLKAAARNPLLTFSPGPAHVEWLNLQGSITLLRAPSQSGKTTAAAWALVHYCLGTHPYVPCKTPPINARVVCHSFDQSKVVQSKVYDMIPEGVLDPSTEFHKARGFKNKTILFNNGSMIVFVTASQERLALASATLDLIWIDEPPPEETYAECVSRLVQTNGRLMMTLTPVGRPLKWLRTEVESNDSSIEEVRYGLSTDACPWMTEEQVKQAVSRCLPSQRPQVIYAEWDGVTVDRFIEAFDPEVHSSGEINHEGEVKVRLAFDHGELPGKEIALLVYMWLDKDTGRPFAHIAREYKSPGRTTEAMDAMAIKNILEEEGLSLLSVDDAVGDVNSAGKSRAGSSVNEIMSESFAVLNGGRRPFRISKPRKGPGSILRGANAVNTAFLDDRLTIDPSCIHLIDSLSHWRGKSSSPFKDAFDALSYGVADWLDLSTNHTNNSRLDIRVG